MARLLELRLLALYPGADEHLRRPRQHPLPAAPLRVARDRLLATPASGPGEGFDPARARPDLHRRRPGPRPGARRRGHAAHASATRSPPRSRTAPRCSPSAAATSCSATATSSATSAIPGLGLADLETVREQGPRLIGNVAIEVDLGDGPRALAGFENHGGRTHLGAGAEPLGRVLHGHGNNGSDGLEGVRAPEHDRHLPARPAAAQERLARRPPDRARARAPRPAREPELEPLDDELEAAAHEAALRAASAARHAAGTRWRSDARRRRPLRRKSLRASPSLE